MRAFLSLGAVLVLVLIGYAGAYLPPAVFGVAIPYLAIGVFVFGVAYRVIDWATSAVPFRIPTTVGQEKSLPWIKQAKLDNPSGALGVIGRMALEVLVFRSLFKNTKMELKQDRNLAYGQEMWLWLAGLVFHWSFLIVFLRHFRFFMEPTPFFSTLLAGFDGFFEIGVPTLYLSGVALLAAASYLFIRRVIYPQMRYISLASDYFPLFLILAIATSGILMRHFFKVDLLKVNELALGLFSFSPNFPEGIGAIFYVHLFLVSVLIAYFPFSKLTHMAGVFMSPTRNLANNSRMRRHVNPWDYPVKVHTYEEWEDEFRELMKESGIPVEKETSDG